MIQYWAEIATDLLVFAGLFFALVITFFGGILLVAEMYGSAINRAWRKMKLHKDILNEFNAWVKKEKPEKAKQWADWYDR